MSDDDIETLEDARNAIESLQADFSFAFDRLNAAHERIGELEDQLEASEEKRERLIFRVGKLESTLPDETTPYDEMDRSDKVARLRGYLMERAYAANGKFAMDYDDVITLFHGGPSAAHAYDLMEWAAADEEGNVDAENGFTYQKNSRPKQIRVNLDVANAQPDFSRANKTETEGGR